MGIAVTCRQYNLALLPAAMLFALYQFRESGRSIRDSAAWLVGICASLVLAVLPVFLLVLVWKGLSSPGMATSTSYANWQAGVGLNFSRPLITAFYVAVYLVPFTFPVMMGVTQARRWRILPAALRSGVVAAYCQADLLTPGPLHTVIGTLSRGSDLLQSLIVGLVAAVAIYNVCALGLLIWEKRSVVSTNSPVAFGLLVILCFVGEQIGVGGNIPFYDRYLLTAAPFMGLIAFSVLPRLRLSTLCGASSMMSLAGRDYPVGRNLFGGAFSDAVRSRASIEISSPSRTASKLGQGFFGAAARRSRCAQRTSQSESFARGFIEMIGLNKNASECTLGRLAPSRLHNVRVFPVCRICRTS